MEKPINYNKNTMSRYAKQIQTHKILSTSMTYSDGTCPQWVSDTQLNYMSQYDFMSYDMDQDRIELIQKPKGCKHQVLNVRYSPLIGHRNVRIIYLYKQAIKKNTQNVTNQQQQTYAYNFMILPSFNFTEQNGIKKITIQDKSIKYIQTFLYLSDGQSVLFPILYSDDTIGLVFMGLTNSRLICFDFQEQTYKYQLNKHEIKSLYNFSIMPQAQTQHNILNTFESPQLRIFRQSFISLTKQFNEFIFICGNKIHIFHISIGNRQLKLKDCYEVKELEKENQPHNRREIELQSFCPVEDAVSINLSKTFIIIKSGLKLLLYYIEQAHVHFASEFNTQIDEFQEEYFIKISASPNANRILITLAEKARIYQYRINDLTDTIQYINCIDLQSDHGSHINKILLSDTGRNAAIFSLVPYQSAEKEWDGKVKVNINHFSIFKIQLYSELGIPQSSLYMKQMKYKNRNKKVNRLVIPKIYQKLHALTGSQVHSLENHKISGVLFFDLHPTGFYMAISDSFNIKIYSLEYDSMTLLYSTSMQNLRKVLYSPDGSTLFIFSYRKLKILNAYSFQLQDEIIEKSNSIVDICFCPKRNTYMLLYDNGVVTERSFLDPQKIKSFRVYGHGHRKITTLKMDQKNENLFVLIQEGFLIIKNLNNLSNNSQACQQYPDGQKISQIFIDTKNSLIFIGTKSGKLRIHDVSIEDFMIQRYTQIGVSYSQITAIICSSLQSYAYIGSISGDITMIKYNPYNEGSLLAKSSKILKNVAPRVNAYFSFDFQLISAVKFQGNSQQNALEDKLQNLIQKIHHHTNNFRQSFINSYAQKQKQYSYFQDDNRNIYKQFDTKCKKIKTDIHLCRDKLIKNKKDLTEEYEVKIKELFSIQDKLNKEKRAIEKNFEKCKKELLEQNRKEIIKLEKQLNGEIDKNEMVYNQEHFAMSLNDLDAEYKISDSEVLKSLNAGLTQQLNKLKNRSMELNKNNGYLQTAKTNMISRKVQQQTLQHRINQQLKMLKQINVKQKDKINELSKQLKSTEQLIHKIQKQVKNTPNNLISSDKVDSDLCSYKIWMKQTRQEEIFQLQQYLQGLDKSFERKSYEMVEITNRIKKNVELIGQIQEKIQLARQKLNQKKPQLGYLKNKNKNIQKILQPNQLILNMNKENNNENTATKIKKIISMERINQKFMYSQNKNIKIHLRKYKNMNTNNAELLSEFETLRFQNKELMDEKQRWKAELEKVKQILKQEKRQSTLKNMKSERTSIHESEAGKSETPFLKYVRNRAFMTKQSCMNLLSTATATSRVCTPQTTPRERRGIMRNTTSKFY